MGRSKRRRLLLLLLSLVLPSSCGRLPPDSPAGGVGRAAYAERDIADENTAPTARAGHEIFGMAVTDTPLFEAIPGDGTEEIDLTDLSVSALYATVGMMNAHPEPYDGKTVRIAGYFTTEQTRFGIRYSCSVVDIAGCCFESVEIRYAETPEPDEVPVDGTVVTVSGCFGFYQVNEYLHYTFIADAVIEDGE